MEERKEISISEYDNLTSEEARVFSEYILDFNVNRTSVVCNLSRKHTADILNREQVKKAIYRYADDRMRKHSAMLDKTLENLSTITDSDMLEYADWDEEGIRIKDSATVKNTKAIKAIKMGKFGPEIVLHDKPGAINAMLTTLQNMQKVMGGETALIPSTNTEADKKDLAVILDEAFNKQREEALSRATDAQVEDIPCESTNA